jgi:hypothetical protein
VPDQVEHPAVRSAFGTNGRERLGELVAQGGGVLAQAARAREGRGQLVNQGEVVDRIARMRDDDLRRIGAPGLDGVDGLLAVLVDVDEQVGRREPAQLGQVDVLGAAHLGDSADPIARVDAKAGAGHQAVAKAQRKHQLGQAGNQALDARRGGVAGSHGDGIEAAAKQQKGTSRIIFFPQFTYIRQSVSGSRAFLK